jgi:hypothetical protein
MRQKRGISANFWQKNVYQLTNATALNFSCAEQNLKSFEIPIG